MNPDLLSVIHFSVRTSFAIGITTETSNNVCGNIGLLKGLTRLIAWRHLAFLFGSMGMARRS